MDDDEGNEPAVRNLVVSAGMALVRGLRDRLHADGLGWNAASQLAGLRQTLL
jgi:hypothetical protein